MLLLNQLLPFVKKMRINKYFFLITFTSFASFILLAKIATKRDLGHNNIYREPIFLPKNFKYILLWNYRIYAPLSHLEDGQRTFLKNNCSVKNCYVSSDVNLFGTDFMKFDAIVFNGRTMNKHRLPGRRSSHQMYIYSNMESSDYYPVCDRRFDNFFNLTATYRLDSDMLYNYILIRDKIGEIVGPKHEMEWVKDMKEVDKEYKTRLKKKSKLAAWFVSNCKSRNKRENFVSALNEILLKYGYNIDIYGYCGNLKCSKENDDCYNMLSRDYFFYLCFENSDAEDYVTEKLLTALNHDVVPIVYGAANYSRYLPPGSYIDSRQYTVVQLAALMNRLMHSPEMYSKYFNWKAYYTYSDSAVENVCRLCETLNHVHQKTYMNFRSWWNPNYRNRCRWFW